MNNKKKISLIVGLVLGIIIAFISPPAELTRASMRAMGIIVCAIVWLSMDVFPTYITTTLMCTSFVLFKCVEMTVAFGSFADTNFWLIVAVIGIGVAIQKCGLIKRLSYHALKLFPPTYNGVIAAILGVGAICQPLMPSTSAKQSVVAPVAVSLGETLGFEKKSRQMAGLFNALYIGWSVLGCLFISASFLGYLYLGNLPEETQKQFTWGTWFISMIPWAIVILVGSYLTLTKIYKPDKEKKITKDYLNQLLKDLGPMSKDEKLVSVVMVIAILLWILENKIGIAACTTALLCLMFMAILGIFKPADFNTKMGWTLIIYIGGIFNISTVMGQLGISNWLGALIEPILGGLISKPYLFTLLLVLAIYILRYAIASMSAAAILITVVFSPLAVAAGINPWVVMMIAYCSTPVWVTKYQNTNMLVGWAAFGGDDQVNFHDVLPGAYAYMAVNLVALLVSVPFWQLLGYLG